MSGPRWLASPLAGTAAVLAGLALLAIPLRHLTSEQHATPMQTAPDAAFPKDIPAILRLKLLAPAKRLALRTAAGKVLLDARDLAPGESEFDVVMPFADGGLDLTMMADFGADGGATAVFLTVMPDGYEDQTRYAIGTGLIEQSLRYDWPPQ